MYFLPFLRSSLKVAPIMFVGLLTAHGAVAQTKITNDYIYIGVEAEDHVSKDERWVTTTPTTPATEPDPDGNHSDTASGSTYLELLPDIRVTHADPQSPPRAFWGPAGIGPRAEYKVNFPEAGRYYIHVRAYSTGTEDNGIHFGLNGKWPDTSDTVQFCSASKRSWWWSSAQRDSGGNGSCGTQHSLWFDIPSAGQHTVLISAREDGFELDRFALIKDLSGNTRVCSATNITGVNCKNGSIESADGFVDMRLRFESLAEGADPEVEVNPTVVVAGENLELTAQLENLDGFDTATDIVLTLSPVPGEWEMVRMDGRCEADGNVFNCELDELEPTAPNKNIPFKFVLRALVTGDIRIDGSVVAAEADDTPNNHLAASVIKVTGQNVDPIFPVNPQASNEASNEADNAPDNQVTPEPVVVANTDSDVKLTMDTNKNTYVVDDLISVSAKITTLGDNDAEDVVFSLNVPSGLKVQTSSLPAKCSGATDVSCQFASIASGKSEAFTIQIEGPQAGIYSLGGSVTASNDTVGNNNNDTDTVVVNNPEPVEISAPVDVDQNVPVEISAPVDADQNVNEETTSVSTGDVALAAIDGTATEIMPVDAVVVDNVPATVDAVEQTTEVVTTDAVETVEAVTTSTVAAKKESKSGSMTMWFILLLAMLVLTRALIAQRVSRQLVKVED